MNKIFCEKCGNGHDESVMCKEPLSYHAVLAEVRAMKIEKPNYCESGSRDFGYNDAIDDVLKRELYI